MEILYFTSGAIALMLGIIIKPYADTLVSRIKQYFTRTKRTDDNIDIIDVFQIAKMQEEINEIKEQMDNIVEAKYVRERNRKNNIRREVRDYLAELRSDK